MTSKHDTKAADQKHETEDKLDGYAKRILASIHELKGMIVNPRSEKKTESINESLEHKRDRRPLWIACGITFVYTIFAGAQWLAVKDSNTISNNILVADQKRFVADQRPYIWFNTEQPNIQPNKNIIWNVFYENYGRSPAFNLRSCFGLLVRQGNIPLLMDESFKQNVPAPSFTKCLQPPGGKGFSSAISYGYSPDAATVEFIKHSYVGIMIVEAISEYEDASGNHYTSTFCDMYSPGGGADIQCPYYNNMEQK